MLNESRTGIGYDEQLRLIIITKLENYIVRYYNPFRYRGYYYDIDLGWYYLQSRYYNPETGRFLNADGYVSTGTGLLGYNMFAYCNNNPVMCIDSNGEFPLIPIIKAVIGIFGIVALVDFSLWALGPSEEEHYSRNEHNIVPDDEEIPSIVDETNEDWEAEDDKYNKYHKFTHGTQGEEAVHNKKYMTKDGKHEVIICVLPSNTGKAPYIVTDPVNVGTHNYGTDRGINHLIQDVIPYYRWGNSADDTTNWFERVFGN